MNMHLAGELLITGYGLNCAAGDRDFALLAAAACGLCDAAPDPLLETRGPHGAPLAVRSCRVIDPQLEPDVRLRALWAPALDDALQALDPPAADRPVRTALVLCTPPTESARTALLDLEAWAMALRGHPALPVDCTPAVVAADAGTIAPLLDQAERLAAGEIDRLVFGAVDSLAEPLGLSALAESGPLATGPDGDGLIPGEAAVFLVLERDEPDAVARALGRLRALSLDHEPGHPRVTEQRLEALARVLSAAATAAGHAPADIDCLVHPLDGRPARHLEWHHARDGLWPCAIDEAQRMAMQRGELDTPQPDTGPERETLDPAAALGDTGITEPLLGLLLACARLRYDWPPRQAVAAALFDGDDRRAAAWLEPPGADTGSHHSRPLQGA